MQLLPIKIHITLFLGVWLRPAAEAGRGQEERLFTYLVLNLNFFQKTSEICLKRIKKKERENGFPMFTVQTDLKRLPGLRELNMIITFLTLLLLLFYPVEVNWGYSVYIVWPHSGPYFLYGMMHTSICEHGACLVQGFYSQICSCLYNPKYPCIFLYIFLILDQVSC